MAGTKKRWGHLLLPGTWPLTVLLFISVASVLLRCLELWVRNVPCENTNMTDSCFSARFSRLFSDGLK